MKRQFGAIAQLVYQAKEILALFSLGIQYVINNKHLYSHQLIFQISMGTKTMCYDLLY